MARRKRNLTQVQVAKRLGLTQGTVSQYESDRVEPSLSALVKMAKVFKCSVSELVEGD